MTSPTRALSMACSFTAAQRLRKSQLLQRSVSSVLMGGRVPAQNWAARLEASSSVCLSKGKLLHSMMRPVLTL